MCDLNFLQKNQKSMTMKEKLSLNKDGNKNYLRFKITTIKKEISKLEKSQTIKEKNDENDQQSDVEDKHLQQLKKSLKELTHADDLLSGRTGKFKKPPQRKK